MRLDQSLMAEPFGNVEGYAHPEGLRVPVPSATETGSTGRPAQPMRRASNADGLPALIEFVCAPGSTDLALCIPDLGEDTRRLV
jgi:hypothetical protein